MDPSTMLAELDTASCLLVALILGGYPHGVIHHGQQRSMSSNHRLELRGIRRRSILSANHTANGAG